MKYVLALIAVVAAYPLADRGLREYRYWDSTRPLTISDPIPARFADRKEIAFVLDEPVAEPLSNGDLRLFLRLINPSNTPLYYYGHTEPSTRKQVLVNEIWVTVPPRPGCGTGIRPYIIPPGHSKAVCHYVKKGSFPVKIGMSYTFAPYPYDGKYKPMRHDIWSDPIESPAGAKVVAAASLAPAVP